MKYETQDFYPACALIASGIEYETEQLSRGQWKWIFDDGKKAREALHKYEHGTLQVDALKIVNIINLMKSKVKN